MQDISKLSAFLEKEISTFDFPAQPANLYDPLRYFLTLGGKRMRPILTMLGAELFDVPGKNAVNAAIAVELFHNFSLIHDDIMDAAPLRRKKQTVHTKWNTNIAILSGDVLLVKAYQEICKQDAKVLPRLLEIFNRTAIEVCEGQQLDMDFETRNDVSIEEYIEMIRLKTSVLLGCALEMGAVVAEAKKEDQELIYSFGEHIGVAFQIQDDILDLYADPEKFGKQVGGDVLANKKTLLLLKANELANPAEIETLNKLSSESNQTLKIESTRNLFDKLGVREAARAMMDEHYVIALNALEKISVSDSNKKPLKDLADMLLHREM
jgi:geranylgeranyl diphosphate synthase type II